MKEVVVNTFSKKPSLDSMELGNFGTISNIPFLDTWFKCVVAKQCKGFLEDSGHLDRIQSGCLAR